MPPTGLKMSFLWLRFGNSIQEVWNKFLEGIRFYTKLVNVGDYFDELRQIRIKMDEKDPLVVNHFCLI